MRTRKFIRKFHRWVGLIASLWLLVLASTGYLLQHSQQWQLDKYYINNSLILNAYGIGEQFIAFQQDNQQLMQLDKQIIQNEKPTIKLAENINSATYYQNNWVIATNTQIHWIDNSGQILQSLDEMDQINVPIDKIGTHNQNLVYLSNDKIYTVENLSIVQDIIQNTQWPKITTNVQLKNKAILLTSHNYLTAEQMIFDIHAGITTPSILNDIAAISLIILSLSGIFLFFRKRKRNRP